jgi:outer membrane protein OmpA-like peptidoglycan-associated protein
MELKLTLEERLFQFESPAGPGETNEISAPKGDPYFFREEHFTHWFQFKTPFTGVLSLEVRPINGTDDYDFLLFRDTTGRFCEQILNKEILPIRSMISRNDLKLQSKTGLDAYARKKHQKEGVGDAYTQAVNVTKGDRYYLVIDNVYGGGAGYELELFFFYRPKLNGTVTDAETTKPISAKIYLETVDTGKRVDSVSNDPQTGQYFMDKPLEFRRDHRLSFYSDGYFLKHESLEYARIRRNRGEPIDAALDPIREGMQLTLDDINFRPGSPEFLRSTFPKLDETLSLLKQYPTLVVELQGHVNGVGVPNCEEDDFSNELSWQRARAVRKYMLDKGIPEARMEVKGFGCTQMLFPNATSEKEMAANRRVEMKVLKY